MMLKREKKRDVIHRGVEKGNVERKESQFGDENEIKKSESRWEIDLSVLVKDRRFRWAAVVAEETELNTSATFDKTFVVILDDDTVHLHNPTWLKIRVLGKTIQVKLADESKCQSRRNSQGRMKRSKRKPSREAFDKME